MEYIEITAKTVNEAITKACMQLGKPSSNLDIEVVSEGSKGFLGLGNKPAVIRVAEKEEASVQADDAEAATGEADGEVKERHKRNRNKKRDRKKGGRKPETDGEEPERRTHEEVKREPIIKTDEEVAAMKEASEKFLKDVFAAMGMSVELNMEYLPEAGCFEVELAGDEMGLLIGKRGQTLDSLQYLTSLVVNKGQKGYVRVKLDTEDYRRRRKETLENLAKNIASKVKKTRRPVVLEPMNPYERRIIHSALQPNKYVETYSDGKEPYRHIVVAPKHRRDYEEED